MNRRTSLWAVASSLLVLAACEKTNPSTATPDAAPSASAAATSSPLPSEVTVLVTADENGYLLAQDAAKKGGAAQVLGVWKAEDHHAAGSAAPTLALSTGDHWAGSSISAFYSGEPMAEAMAKMGYAGSGLGNHELDFGRDQFKKNQEKAAFPTIASNVTPADDDAKSLKLEPFHVYERGGFKIGVIALSSTDNPKTAMAGRFDGLKVSPYEEALATAVPAVWAKSADAVIVLADECPTVLGPIVEKHADWNIAAVVGGHCAAPVDAKAGKVLLLSPAKHLQGFARVKLAFDGSKPAKEKLTSVKGQLVDVAQSTVAPDADLAKTLDALKKKNEATLGEEIGTTTAGIKAGSPEMARWIAGSIRESLKVDAAIVNKKGIRADLPPGKITKGSVYAVLPFENAVLTIKIKGSDLTAALANPNVLADGPKGKIDPAKIYEVATLDYLYFGGDGLELEKADKEPGETGRVWQTPVIEWTKKQASDDKKPLEKSLAK
ncbi:MAG TPA: 5'-nucleotidase C-terminal domain-containing protein [Labilithrix sp.]|nr:5'-nucleotidase C-terminal domain-containing protein [Labilithrix sp.]